MNSFTYFYTRDFPQSLRCNKTLNNGNVEVSTWGRNSSKKQDSVEAQVSPLSDNASNPLHSAATRRVSLRCDVWSEQLSAEGTASTGARQSELSSGALTLALIVHGPR